MLDAYGLVLYLLLVALIGGYSACIIWRARRNAARIRNALPRLTDQEFLSHPSIAELQVPADYALPFRRLIEYEYGLKRETVVTPDQLVFELGAASPHRPMVDDLGLMWLIEHISRNQPLSDAEAGKLTVAELLALAWKYRIPL